MKTKILLIPILIFLISCDNNTEQSKLTQKQLTAKKITVKIKSIKKSLTLIEDISLIETQSLRRYYWSDKGSFYALYFDTNRVIFVFNPTCGYWFPSKIIDNEIIFYWALNEDCIFDRGLRKTFLNIENPIIGEPFGKIKMITDTTFVIDYYYVDWVKKINAEEYRTIDTLFPSYFYKRKRFY